MVDESRGGAFGPCIASEEEGYLVIAIETRTDAGTAIDQRKAMEDLLRAFYREASSFLRCA
ncbi:hypothetical protein GCM10009716_29850 [Streptomyces sodiiphilus]|uniref:Uncharacterized protein n=1 Tax=Streptomyces sodiiphilus TaxID=226217 RepID=A0ABP5APM8_9ACTN